MSDRLCDYCGQTETPAHTCMPWDTDELETPMGEKRRHVSLYLLAGHTHVALTAWKKHPRDVGTRLLVKNALKARHLYDRLFSLAPDLIVPIPQSIRRAFTLEGHPSAILARNLVRELRLSSPIVDALQISRYSTEKRQKERSLIERHEQAPRFMPAVAAGNLKALIKRQKPTLWIVDDFRTTGNTLHAAEKVLQTMHRSSAVRFVWVTLGYRPTFSCATIGAPKVAATNSGRSEFVPKRLSSTG